MSDSLTEGMYATRMTEAIKEAERRGKLTQEERDEEDLEKRVSRAFIESRWSRPNGKYILEVIREIIAQEIKKGV